MQLWGYSCLNLGLTSRSFFIRMRRTLITLRLILKTTSKTLIIFQMAPRRDIRAQSTSISKPDCSSPKKIQRQPSSSLIAPSARTPRKRTKNRIRNSHSAAESESLAREASLSRKQLRNVNQSASRVPRNQKRSSRIIRSPHGIVRLRS